VSARKPAELAEIYREFLQSLQTIPSKNFKIGHDESHRKNQQDATAQQNLLSQCFLIAQHISGDTPTIIRSSKTVTAASDFTLSAAAMAEPLQRPATKNYVKPEAAITVFELLMMGGASPEIC
jgi:hypothetical protein